MVLNKLSCHIVSNHSRMQSVSVILNFQCLLVLAAIFVSASNALQCTVCLDRASCANSPPSQNCTADLVSLHHRMLSFLNPNLDVQSSNVFKCYDLDMHYESPLTGSSVLVVQKGCTYNSTNFCEGWVNTATITSCSTCNSEDDCNKGQTEGTTTPVATTTTTGASDTTTSASVTTSTAATTTTTGASDTTTSTSVTTSTAAATTTTEASNTTTSASVTTSTAAAGTTTTEATNTTPTPANSTTTSASVTTTTTATTMSVPVNGTTTSAGTTVTPAGTSTTTVSTTTAKTGGATNLGCVVNWFTIAGYALLHWLIARW